MQSKIVAIHQPNFFPWLGYFDKIARCDIFVFLDHVQFPKKGGSWSNRVKMLVAGEPQWVTAPIVREYHGLRAIRDMEYIAANPWRQKILKTIANNYSNNSYFKETFQFIEPLILSKEANVSIYNTNAILSFARLLEIPEEKFKWSSALSHEGQSNEMLISLTKAVGGDIYMCGGGSEGYQLDTLYKEAGVNLLYQDFHHPEYKQYGRTGPFVAGLSIIDAFMNIGLDATKHLLLDDNRSHNG